MVGGSGSCPDRLENRSGEDADPPKNVCNVTIIHCRVNSTAKKGPAVIISETAGPSQSWEWEFATLSSPSAEHWAPGLAAGCQLPDAVLHGKRSLRSRSRTVPSVSGAELLSEASLPGSEPTRRWIRARHGLGVPARASCHFRFPPGRPPLLAERLPGATGLTSYLSSRFSLAAGRHRF